MKPKKLSVILAIICISIIGVGLIVSLRLEAEEKERNKQAQRRDGYEQFEGPMVACTPKAGGRQVVIRDAKTGELGYLMFTDEVLDNPRIVEPEVADAIRNREYGAGIGAVTLYSKYLASDGAYEDGYPVDSAWVYKGERKERWVEGTIIAYLWGDRYDGVVAVIRTYAVEEVLLVRLDTENYKYSNTLRGYFENKTVGGNLKVWCEYHDYSDGVYTIMEEEDVFPPYAEWVAGIEKGTGIFTQNIMIQNQEDLDVILGLAGNDTDKLSVDKIEYTYYVKEHDKDPNRDVITLQVILMVDLQQYEWILTGNLYDKELSSGKTLRAGTLESTKEIGGYQYRVWNTIYIIDDKVQCSLQITPDEPGCPAEMVLISFGDRVITKEIYDEIHNKQ